MERKNEVNNKDALIEKIAERYKEKFIIGLTEKEKRLFVYRAVIEMAQNNDFVKEGLKDIELEPTDLLRALVKASDNKAGMFSSLILYTMCGNDEKYKTLYTESLNSYKKILENYKKLAQELKLENSLDISHLFTYMLWNGYYSVTKTHSYKLQERLLLPGMYSFDVIKGKGVCLAYAELLRNYLNVCDKKASILDCKVPTGKDDISYDYRPQVNRGEGTNAWSKIVNKMVTPILGGLTNKTGNHAVTLIEEGDKLYIYDPTNLYVLNVIDDTTASIINGKGNFYIKPFSTLIINPNSDPNQLFEKLVRGNINPAFTRKEVIFSFENMIELIKNNINLLDDAYDNIHYELEIIDKQTDELGGRLKVLKKIKQEEQKRK